MPKSRKRKQSNYQRIQLRNRRAKAAERAERIRGEREAAKRERAEPVDDPVFFSPDYTPPASDTEP